MLLANSRGEYLGSPSFAADFLLDTTRAAFNLVLGDVPGRYPGIRFILAHAGGFVPYAAHRLALTIAGRTGRDLAGVMAGFRSFYFDTAISSSPITLPTLFAFAEPGHVLYGSDWPYAPDYVISHFTTGLDGYSLTDVQREDILRGAAEVLFPRLGSVLTSRR